MKKLLFVLFAAISFQVSAQFQSGSGVYPLDTTILIHQNDADFIQIPENSLWQKTRGTKLALENRDSSWVLITDTVGYFVSRDTSYFDIKIPNALLFGGVNSEYYKNAYDYNFESIFFTYLSSYAIVIENQIRITDESKGMFLYKAGDSELFDTVGMYYENSERYNECGFGVSKSSTPEYPEEFWINDNYIISGDTYQKWNYTWLYFEFIPASLKNASLNDHNILDDTTTVRVLYVAPDPSSGGAGWMIKSIRIYTYICLQNCPSEVEEINTETFNGSIYPNPVGHTLHYNPGNVPLEKSSCTIVNTLGQKVDVDYVIKDGELHFNTAKLNRGTYVLWVKSSGISKSYLFIK